MESDFVLEYLTESKNLSFLYDPKSYYNQLCTMFKNATQKIVISCLYIGTLPLEQDLVNCIFYAKKNNPDLIVEILLDKQRSLRRENTGKCILDLLQPLFNEKNVNIRLYHSPLCDALINKMLRPPYSEVLGTLHMKIYVADSLTVISGANCSTPYFTNRMDRYMVVDDMLFSNLMHTVVSTVSTMAFKATGSLGFEWDSDVANPLDDCLLFKKQIYRRFVSMIKMCNDALEPILMGKVAVNLGYEEKKPKSVKLFSKFRQRSKSLHSNSNDSLVSQNSIVTNRSFLNTSRSSIVNNHNGTQLLSQSSIDFYNSIDSAKEYEEIEEGILRESLSGHYLLTPHSYSQRYNSTNRSNLFNSKTSINSYKTINSSRSLNVIRNGKNGKGNGGNEYCVVCDNYNGLVFDDNEYTPHKIRRRYPPVEGFTRFMIFFQLGFSEPPFRQDEVLCKDLMIKYRKSGHSVVLATSYLNFTEDYSDLCSYLINCKNSENPGSFYVLTSSPTSNDFHNCTDSKKLIPSLYCHYQRLLLDYVFKRSPRLSEEDGSEALDNCFYYEYLNPGYTFHHKGIWMFHGDIPKNPKSYTFDEFKKTIKGPCAMLIGSSNLSRRSHNKDLEMTLLVETNSLNVLDPVKYEVYSLFTNATPVSKNTVSKRATLFHRILAFVLRQYF